MLHACQQRLHRNKQPQVLVTLDLANTFNSINWSAVINAVRIVTPDLKPWCDSCYHQPGQLIMDKQNLLSALKLQQADHLGP
eukprot:7529088-Karenia_brevis.AAC.1